MQTHHQMLGIIWRNPVEEGEKELDTNLGWLLISISGSGEQQAKGLPNEQVCTLNEAPYAFRESSLAYKEI